MNLQTGAFGDPSQTETLVLFWAKMEELHYPGAGTTKAFLEEKLERERQRVEMEAYRSTSAAAAEAAPDASISPFQAGAAGLPPGVNEETVMRAIDEKARQDALAAVRP